MALDRKHQIILEQLQLETEEKSHWSAPCREGAGALWGCGSQPYSFPQSLEDKRGK
jgi:hypothetical protein